MNDKKIIEKADDLDTPDRDDGSKAAAPDAPSNAQETIGKEGDDDDD